MIMNALMILDVKNALFNVNPALPPPPQVDSWNFDTVNILSESPSSHELSVSVSPPKRSIFLPFVMSECEKIRKNCYYHNLLYDLMDTWQNHHGDLGAQHSLCQMHNLFANKVMSIFIVMPHQIWIENCPLPCLILSCRHSRVDQLSPDMACLTIMTLGLPVYHCILLPIMASLNCCWFLNTSPFSAYPHLLFPKL